MLSAVAVLPLSAQSRDKNLTITVTTPVGEYLGGQPVMLKQSDYDLSYGTLKLDADGRCTVKVYEGNHLLEIERPGFEKVTREFMVAEDMTVSVSLTEKTRNPFALQAQVAHDAYTGRNDALVSWNTEAPAFFDDFESYSPFAVSFGEWTGIDADLEAAAPLLGDYPNRGVLQYAQVINPLAVTPTWWYDYPILRPYDGKQYVGFTRTNSGAANDDWLISPAVTVGTDNVLSFMAKAADQYPERFMVYVTTKLDNPVQADFTRIDLGNVETVDYKGWHEFTYDLSSYAGQQIKFAIRYVGEYNRYGSFMLMVDNVYVGQAQTAAAAKVQSKARRVQHRSQANPNEVFHIFLDGVKVGETEDYIYTISDIPVGSHVVGVKAVYKAAESELVSTPLTVAADGYAKVVFTVTANSQLSADGQVISLVNTQTSDAYELTVAEGGAQMASLPYGNYVVNIAGGAFNEYQRDLQVTGDVNVSIELTDRILTPYNITADATPGASGGSSVVLKWNQELLFNDSFEDYDDFATGNFGEWRSVDLDQQPIYPIGLGGYTTIVSFPGSGTATNPQPLAPIVFNPWNTTPAMLPTDMAVAAPTGDKTIAFFSAQRGQSDKWLISPELTIRDGYVVRCTMKSYDASYTESVDFAVAVGSDAPADFSVISSADNIPAGEWTIYESSLSEYAGQKVRIGVHYKSYDTFFLQLDDFIVGPEGGEAEFVDYGNVVRYDIYVDGVKVGESVTSTFTIDPLPEGPHTIGIKAIYKNGESEMATYEWSGTGIEGATLARPWSLANARMDNGQRTTAHVVYDLQGRKVSTVNSCSGKRAELEFPLAKRGVYLIKSGNRYIKVMK